MSEPEGRGAAWTEERGPSGEAPPPQAARTAPPPQAVPEASGRQGRTTMIVPNGSW
jgi:hypothetical protein